MWSQTLSMTPGSVRKKQESKYGGKKFTRYILALMYNDRKVNAEGDMTGNIQLKEEQIVELLKAKAEVWQFPRLLEEIGGDTVLLRHVLTEKMIEYDTDGEESREQISRKVRNWFNGKNQPSNREEMFKICFALGLGLEKAEKFLLSAEECGIHYRNPRELIYAFCLKKGYGYLESRELVRILGQDDVPRSTLECQKMIRRSSSVESTEHMTISVRDDFKNIENENELKLFLKENQHVFGLHHNTAYRKFKRMLDCLMSGNSENNRYTDAPDEKRYSIVRVTEEYLRLGIPYEKRSVGYSKVEKMLKKHWPSVKTVQEMYSRKRDVNRKTLLLLYLATEGMGISVAEESFVEEHCQRMDMMLLSCGMPLLNLHNPFDYLAVQSLLLESDDDFMSWKMERILRKLFRETYQPAYISISHSGK